MVSGMGQPIKETPIAKPGLQINKHDWIQMAIDAKMIQSSAVARKENAKQKYSNVKRRKLELVNGKWRWRWAARESDETKQMNLSMCG